MVVLGFAMAMCMTMCMMLIMRTTLSYKKS